MNKLEMSAKLADRIIAERVQEERNQRTLERSLLYRKSLPSYKSIIEGGTPKPGFHFSKWVVNYPTPGNRLCVRCGEVQERGLSSMDLGHETWTTVGYVNPDVEEIKSESSNKSNLEEK